MNYIIESKLSIGDVVSPKLNPEKRYFVAGFEVTNADEFGNVTTYLVVCTGGDGTAIKMYEYEIELLEIKANEA